MEITDFYFNTKTSPNHYILYYKNIPIFVWDNQISKSESFPENLFYRYIKSLTNVTKWSYNSTNDSDIWSFYELC